MGAWATVEVCHPQRPLLPQGRALPPSATPRDVPLPFVCEKNMGMLMSHNRARQSPQLVINSRYGTRTSADVHQYSGCIASAAVDEF